MKDRPKSGNKPRRHNSLSADAVILVTHLQIRRYTDSESMIQAKPAPPATIAGVQNGSYGPICVQPPETANESPSSPNMNEGEVELGMTPIGAKGDIDCLFLDIYVPAAAVKNPSLRLPVISWIYGGAYVNGGKDEYGDVLPFYDGTGLIQESGGNVIFVASNYRVYSLPSAM